MTSPFTSSQLTEGEAERRALCAEKHTQASTLLREEGIDCWLTFTREGTDLLLPFLTGLSYIAGVSALMLFADGPSAAVVADYDRSQVEGIFDDVHAYSGDWKEPFAEVLRQRQPATIAVNYSESDFGIDGLTHGMYVLLARTLESLGMTSRLVSSEPIAGPIRSRKTPQEVERIRRACQITERIFDDVTGMLRAGLTEADVAAFIHERMDTYDVVPSWDAALCPSVVTGDREAGHTAPTGNVIQPGDTVRIDFGVIYEDYCSDLQRTWYVKRPGETAIPGETQRRFDAVRDGIALAVERIKPGVIGWDVDAPVRNLIAERGYSFTHALGHQLGRRVHDGGVVLGPNNGRYGDRSGGVIEEGMVFTLEPCIQGAQIEEDIVVRADGCEYFVPPQTELLVV